MVSDNEYIAQRLGCSQEEIDRMVQKEIDAETAAEARAEIAFWNQMNREGRA